LHKRYFALPQSISIYYNVTDISILSSLNAFLYSVAASGIFIPIRAPIKVPTVPPTPARQEKCDDRTSSSKNSTPNTYGSNPANQPQTPPK